MAMKFVVNEVIVENIKKGKNPYSIATVVHTYNGQARTQKIVSFATPASFDVVKSLNAGDTIEVEVSKNAQGYNQWDSVVVGNSPVESKSTPTGGRVTGSNYETKDERAARQVLIVKQSSLSAAVAFLTKGDFNNAEGGVTKADVLELAQEFTDWVFNNNLSLADMPNDIID